MTTAVSLQEVMGSCLIAIALKKKKSKAPLYTSHSDLKLLWFRGVRPYTNPYSENLFIICDW